jgi:ketosteroid isomerase-like protein
MGGWFQIRATIAPMSTAATADTGVLDLADRMFRAIEAGDLDTLRAIYAADFVAWSNFDDGTKDVDGTLAVLGWLCHKLGDRRYDVSRREVIDGGFLQQHVLRGTAPDGSAVAMPACIVATVTDGQVVRIDEYLDPSALAALSKK